MSEPPLTLNGWLRYDVVDRLLRDLDGVGSVLEIGAGEGPLAVRLARRYAYVGLEPDPASFAVARARLARLRSGVVLQGDVSSLEPGRTFDLVCAFEVLEHLERPADAFAEMARVASRALVASVPREPAWRVLSFLSGHYVAALGNTPGHVNHWSRRTFGRFAACAGEVVRVRTPFPWTMVTVVPEGRR